MKLPDKRRTLAVKDDEVAAAVGDRVEVVVAVTAATTVVPPADLRGEGKIKENVVLGWAGSLALGDKSSRGALKGGAGAAAAAAGCAD
jgi:hypothetical protein